MSPDLSSTLTNGVSSTSTTLTLPNTSSSSITSNSINNSNASSKKPPDSGGAGGGGGGGGGNTPPRVDLEPIYEGLRAGLSLEQWLRYKQSLSSYLLGRINRQELSTAIDPILTGPKQRLHNQLLMGIYTNACSRDPPPHEIAPYVLATNRASNTLSRNLRNGLSAPTDSGDARVEARLKTEVMSLAARDRRRIKEVPENLNPEEILPSILFSYHQAKQIKIPDPQSEMLNGGGAGGGNGSGGQSNQNVVATPSTAGALSSKTNWEAEVKNRYSIPLACESGEFPELDGIRSRMLPICYEEGAVGGVVEQTAMFMNVAAEVFVKEILSSVITRVRCNRTTTVKTDGFKRKMEKMLEEQGSGTFGFGSSGMTFNLNGSINNPPPTSSSNNTSPSQARKRQKLTNGLPHPRNPHPYIRYNKLQKSPRELAGERKILNMDDLRLSFTLGDSLLSQLPLSLNKIMTGGWERPEEYVRVEYDGMPPPPKGVLSHSRLNVLSKEGRNQPNFVKRKAGVSGVGGGERHTNMLDVLVGGVGSGVPTHITQQRLQNGVSTSSSHTLSHHELHKPEESISGPAVGVALWNDGFEPWGPDAAGWGWGNVGGSLGGPGNGVGVGPGGEVDVGEILSSWEFYPPPQQGGMGMSGMNGMGVGMSGMATGMGIGGGMGVDWVGAGPEERRELRGLLDECLAVGM